MASDIQTVRENYLRKYAYSGGADNTNRFLNFTLNDQVTGYAYLPFIVVMGNSIALLVAVGPLIDSSLSDNGITCHTICGESVSASGIVENSHIRLKCGTSKAVTMVTILSLRQGVTVTSGWWAAS